jgi:hypothetical protein
MDMIKLTARPVPKGELQALLMPNFRIHPKASILVDLATREIGAVPLTNFGASAFPINGYESNMRSFAPRSIRLLGSIPGSVVNELKDLDPTYLNTERGEKIADMRDSAKETREAMLALGLRGTYSYPVNQQMGVGVDTTTIGAVHSPTVSTKLNTATPTFAVLQATYKIFQDKIKADSGNTFGGNSNNLVWLVSDDVWAVVLTALGSQYSGSAMAILQQSMIEGEYRGFGMRIKNISGSYKTYASGTTSTAPLIAAKTAIMVDLSAKHFGAYCSVEDLEAGNVPTPMFIKEWYEKDPSVLQILFEQKPFIFPDVRGIALQTVLT